jgi:hypothetical protein
MLRFDVGRSWREELRDPRAVFHSVLVMR